MFKLRLGFNPAVQNGVKGNSDALEVKELDLHPGKNAVPHHTNKFEQVQAKPPTAIVRRGQLFKVTLHFTGRGYAPGSDVIRFIFSFGTNPTAMNGTRGLCTLKEGGTTDPQLWSVTEVDRTESSMSLDVCSPANAPVGEWHIQVESRTADNPAQANTYDHPEVIYILFNPWCKEDDVYMENERLLGEYVLSDIGKIWVGPHGQARGRQWVFGQFDDDVLPAVMLMLERSGVKPGQRGDPVLLTRGISKIVNANDDQGVLLGNWDGEYKNGTPPAAWTGSVPILEKFRNSEREVPYGQCWVFAGVVTTACRALGIPSRVVSNLVSAHDANASLTIDRYFSLKNEQLEYDPNNEEGEDSIWNYHVWNDVWMMRRDLPKGYGGWQAIDATPQETSGGFFQCGPASLEAIKKGAVGFNYDVAFMLSSVNADLVKWREDPTCDLGYKRVECNKYHIGKAIYTKQPFVFDPNGDKDREDITDQYKMKEGTNEERLALYNGIQASSLAKKFYDVVTVEESDIEFDMVDIDTVALGENFSITVNIWNKSNKEREVHAVLSAGSVYYTGVAAHVVKKSSGAFKIKPDSKEMLRLTVRPDEYIDKLVEYCNMKIYAIATVKDTGATWAEEDDFQIIKPKLNIEVKGSPKVHQPCTVVFSFKNPLKKELSSCKFNYSGPGLLKNMEVSYRNIRAQEDVRVEHRFTPFRAGDLNLVATFASNHLVDITGSTTVRVAE